MKRGVLRFVLKELSVEQSLMCLGREFQKVGAAMEKALSPHVLSLVRVGGDRRLASADQRSRVGVWW